jgi:hypothetical protein
MDDQDILTEVCRCLLGAVYHTLTQQGKLRPTIHDSTLANLGSITGHINERVKEPFRRIDRLQRSRRGWRIPLSPQMAANSSQGIDEGGFGFGIPGRVPGW